MEREISLTLKKKALTVLEKSLIKIWVEHNQYSRKEIFKI